MAMIDRREFYPLEQALTRKCFQIGWGAKYYFPCCPDGIGKISLDVYFENIKPGSIFAYHDDSPKLIIVDYARVMGTSSILILCEREGVLCERECYQPWLLAEIKMDNGVFIHSKLGAYFEKDDAHEEFCIKLGLE